MKINLMLPLLILLAGCGGSSRDTYVEFAGKYELHGNFNKIIAVRSFKLGEAYRSSKIPFMKGHKLNFKGTHHWNAPLSQIVVENLRKVAAKSGIWVSSSKILNNIDIVIDQIFYDVDKSEGVIRAVVYYKDVSKLIFVNKPISSSKMFFLAFEEFATKIIDFVQ